MKDRNSGRLTSDTSMSMQYDCGMASCRTHTRSIVFVLLLAFCIPAFAADNPSEKAAQKSAEQWLTLVDAGNYDESWNQAADLFQSHVTKEAWDQQVSTVRGQTGKLKSRKLKSAQSRESLPNAPAGKYVILQYDSSFNAGPAVETVVLMEQKDNSWKVVGYFVKPA